MKPEGLIFMDNDSIELFNDILKDDEIITAAPPTCKIIKIKCPGPCVRLPKYKLVTINNQVEIVIDNYA